MLSYTTNSLGKGWVYALNNALDQTGAVFGPLLMSLVLLGKEDYRTAYMVLLVSAVLALATLAVARMYFPKPSALEAGPSAANTGYGTGWLVGSGTTGFLYEWSLP